MNADRNVLHELENRSSPSKAKILSGFFKTGKGQYGEGDVFLGVTVPVTRSIVKKYWKEASMQDVQELLNSKFHEARLAALLIVVEKFSKTKNDGERKQLFDFYLRNCKKINNWDLVDLSADKVVGAFLQGKEKERSQLLGKLARSQDLWERRIAMLATFHEIKRGNANPTIAIARLLLHDRHDLIHKAAGWMLREVGKRCSAQELEDFLKQNATVIPRTMLRYAIERMPEAQRKHYLALKTN